MKEIKFRAWLKDCDTNKPYALYFDLESISQGSIMARDGEWHYLVNLKNSIEQFTGLRDKNGRDIYEGDIITRRVSDWLGNEYVRAGAVQYARGIFGLNWQYAKNKDPEWSDGAMYGGWGKRHNLRSLDDDLIEALEVIGNIHENPELLND